MKFATNDTLGNHFLKFDKSIRELRSTGATLEETDIVCHLLLTMPVEYDTVVTALETLSKDELSLGFVKNRLLDEESKRKSLGIKKNKTELSSATAFSSSRKGTNKTNKTQPFPYNCHSCGLYGHKRADCRKKPQEKRESVGNNKAQLFSKR